jgi:hypothetical protein
MSDPKTAQASRARRRSARALVGAAMVILCVFGNAGPANASGSWKANVWAPCTSAWNADPYGVTALLHEEYTETTYGTNHILINSAWGIIDHLNDCGPHGGNVPAYRITLDVSFRFRGTNLTCSISYPLGFTCTRSSTDLIFHYTVTCQTFVVVCQHRFGEQHFYATPGMKFQNIAWMQTSARLSASSGDSFSFNTPAI